MVITSSETQQREDAAARDQRLAKAFQDQGDAKRANFLQQRSVVTEARAQQQLAMLNRNVPQASGPQEYVRVKDRDKGKVEKATYEPVTVTTDNGLTYVEKRGLLDDVGSRYTRQEPYVTERLVIDSSGNIISKEVYDTYETKGGTERAFLTLRENTQGTFEEIRNSSGELVRRSKTDPTTGERRDEQGNPGENAQREQSLRNAGLTDQQIKSLTPGQQKAYLDPAHAQKYTSTPVPSFSQTQTASVQESLSLGIGQDSLLASTKAPDYLTIPPNGIKYSQPNSITGGGLVSATGTGPALGLLSGVYTGNKGELVIIKEGPRAKTAGELLPFLPKSTDSPQFNYAGPRGLLFRNSDPNLPNTTVPYDTLITANPISGELRESFLARTGAANFQDVSGKSYKIQYLPVSNDAAPSLAVPGSDTPSRFPFLDKLEKSSLGQGYLSIKKQIAENPNLLEIQTELENTYRSNSALIDKYDRPSPGEVVLNPFIKNPVSRELTKAFVAYPAGILSGVVKQTREQPETLPLAYGAGKVFGLASEGSSYIAARGVAATASEPFLIRTAGAGIAKGIEVAPLVVGGALLTQTGLEIAQKQGLERLQLIGGVGAEIGVFATGDLSVRGLGRQFVQESYIKASGAKQVPLESYAEQKVISGEKAFSTIKAGDLPANRAAFEATRTLGTQSRTTVQEISIPNAVKLADVPKNPPVEYLTYRNKPVSNLEVVHATRAAFPSDTLVPRGTSKQGGLYVAPKGQAQLFFLGLGRENEYSIGLARGGEPNLIETINIKRYSEELAPILRKEKGGIATLSDEYLRVHGDAKTVYLEGRTFNAETPEVQAVIPEGTRLKQLNLRTGPEKFFGFVKYAKTPEGEIVPIRTFTALKGPAQAGTTKEILDLDAGSFRYLQNKNVVDPYRGTIGSAVGISSKKSQPSPTSRLSQRTSLVELQKSPSLLVSKSSTSAAASPLPSLPSLPPVIPSGGSGKGSSNGGRSALSVLAPVSSAPSLPPALSASPSPRTLLNQGSIFARRSALQLPESLLVRIKGLPSPLAPEESQPGFLLFVKKKGKFSLLTTESLSQNEALRLGAREADISPAQTFKIIRSGKNIRASPIGSDVLPSLSKFTTKGDNVYREKQGSLIDTLGEVQQISLKGVLASSKARRRGIL